MVGWHRELLKGTLNYLTEESRGGREGKFAIQQKRTGTLARNHMSRGRGSRRFPARRIYFEAAAGVWVAEVLLLVAAFLFFLTCFFTAGLLAGVVVEAGACAASETPTVASARDRPSAAEAIFFMMI